MWITDHPAGDGAGADRRPGGYADTLENRAVYGGNLYLADYTDDLFGAPLTGRQYLFESDSVPFLQMVYKGHVDMYGDYLNVGNLSRAKIRKMMEYGVYSYKNVLFFHPVSRTKGPCRKIGPWSSLFAEIPIYIRSAGRSPYALCGIASAGRTMLRLNSQKNPPAT